MGERHLAECRVVRSQDLLRESGPILRHTTCAGHARRLCHDSGGELEQIQFLLGHASVQTTERYLGCKQNLRHPVNDLFDLRTERRPDEDDGESVTVTASEPVEMASRQGIECRPISVSRIRKGQGYNWCESVPLKRR